MLKKAWSILRQPVSLDKQALLAASWERLPPDLRTDWQVVGNHLSHCGYTLGPAYCSFGCSHCYLPSNANRTAMPALAEMKEQIDANRRLLGPGGALQITGGDVLDAYFRAGRPDELIEVVRYATEAGLVPMVMTHGHRLLEHPEYFRRLVLAGRLRKLAIHIDVTQAGRPGFLFRDLRSEADLHPLRQRFVDLIHRIRRETGVRLSAAHTVTVTERNLDSLGEIVGWLTADRRRLQAFGMLSLQPEAAVGRTRFSTRPVTPAACWRKLCESTGLQLSADHLWLGHPDCSHWSTVAVLFPERRLVNLFPGDAESRRFWAAVLQVFGGVGSRGDDHVEANLRRIALLLRRPRMLFAALRYARHLLSRERIGVVDLARRFARGQVAFLNLVQHNFMSDDEVHSGSETVKRRLQACSFRGAVKREGRWEAVSMCEMNVLHREDLYGSAQK